MSLIAKRAPKTRRGKMMLEAREPKQVENTKQLLLMFGRPSSERVKLLFRDISTITKPHSKTLDRKKDIRPFEDAEPIEYAAKKNDASLFMVGTHNKKRPHNVIIGRTFDFQVLDMIEVGVDSCQLISAFKGGASHQVGSKPCLTFSGDLWETKPELVQLKSLFADVFRGDVVDNVSLAGLDHVISFTAEETETGPKVYMRHYSIVMKSSGSRVPLVELVEIGPSADFLLRRTKQAAPDVMKLAMKTPKELKPKKRKNVETNVLGDTVARVHMKPQDIYGKLQTRKVKALKKTEKPTKDKVSVEGGGRASKRAKVDVTDE